MFPKTPLYSYKGVSDVSQMIRIRHAVPLYPYLPSKDNTYCSLNIYEIPFSCWRRLRLNMLTKNSIEILSCIDIVLLSEMIGSIIIGYSTDIPFPFWDRFTRPLKCDALDKLNEFVTERHFDLTP